MCGGVDGFHIYLMMMMMVVVVVLVVVGPCLKASNHLAGQ
jgi:hypothetical protein